MIQERRCSAYSHNGLLLHNSNAGISFQAVGRRPSCFPMPDATLIVEKLIVNPHDQVFGALNYENASVDRHEGCVL